MFTGAGISAQEVRFGKNKVRYKDFSWRYIQTRHFDVYFYEDAYPTAKFASAVLESSYTEITGEINYLIQRRIPVFVYNSHNDFQQTNIIPSLIPEGVGGFTEAFKNRIVIPFTGSYEDFRHVLHHELTHAVMYQMLYGKNFGSAVASMARFQVPLWLAEGLAEYESIGWDTDSDMFMRDATLNGYLPPIDQLYGFMAYKGGQSVLHYIAEKYGGPKIGELLGKVRINRNMEQGLKQSIGLNTTELTKRWHKHLRKTYWPDVQGRDEPVDIAKRLTDHNKYTNFINNSPALSPRGDKMIYLTNRSDYIDIYLMSVIDGRNLGRLVQGERSEIFEELHWLRPGMDWSPDGKQIVFSSKMGDKDAIHVLDVETRTIVHSYTYPLDGLFSPRWSPNGNEIVFMGLEDGQSDIYIADIQLDDLRKLTDDVFSDMDPVWSPDGQEIAFVSDRGSITAAVGYSQGIQGHNYEHHDLYIIHTKTREIKRLTDDSAEEKSPAYSPEGDKIAFVTDRNGINNIYIMDIASGNDYPITNLLTGVSQISWSRDGSRLAFASFYDAGYDIYLINNPLDIDSGAVKLEKTAFVLKDEQKKEPLLASADNIPQSKNTNTPTYRNYVFGDAFRKRASNQKKLKQETFFDTTEYKNPEGDYKTKKYKIKFTPDLITGGAGYSQFFGLQGSTMIAFSDILGNHQINLYTDLFYSLKNSNFQLTYLYLPKQTDFGISVFHYSYLYYTYSINLESGYPMLGYIRDRNYGFSLLFSRISSA